jgi:hypothetical protein
VRVRVMAQARFAVTARLGRGSRTRAGHGFRVCWGRSSPIWLRGSGPSPAGVCSRNSLSERAPTEATEPGIAGEILTCSGALTARPTRWMSLRCAPCSVCGCHSAPYLLLRPASSVCPSKSRLHFPGRRAAIPEQFVAACNRPRLPRELACVGSNGGLFQLLFLPFCQPTG